MSVINHKYKHCFVHVPKCAGTSMERTELINKKHSHEPAKSILPRCPEDYFTWSFVRCPYDRLLSSYFYTVDRCYWINKECLETPLSYLNYAMSNNRGLPIIPMSHFLCDDNNRIMVEFVGRYEQLQKDWEFVCSRTIKKELRLPRTNRTSHGAWFLYYDKKLIESVNLHYKLDFEIFGYTKLDPDDSPAEMMRYFHRMRKGYHAPKQYGNDEMGNH